MSSTSDHGVSYAETLDDFLSRLSPPRSVMVDHFHRKQSELSLEAVETFISIGPGSGSFDVEVLKAFPNCQHYIGIEPEEASRRLLTANLEQHHPAMKCEVHGVLVQDWEGPREPVDLVFMSHVLYYINHPRDFIQKTLAWIRPGGLLIIVHEGDRSEWAKYDATLMRKSEDYYLSEQVADDLKALGVNIVAEDRFEYTFNVKKRTRNLVNCCNYKHLENCSDEQIAKFYQFLDTEFHQERLLPADNSIFYIRI